MLRGSAARTAEISAAQAIHPEIVKSVIHKTRMIAPSKYVQQDNRLERAGQGTPRAVREAHTFLT
jgi:hypothetical protein